MPWNPNTKIMTTPIGMGDISQAVGYASGDLGTLIKNGVINKWARFKPFCYNSPSITDAQRDARNHGMTMKRFTSLASMFNEGVLLTPNTGEAWVYDSPRGLSNSEWFRALDFDGYRGNTTPPDVFDIVPNPAYGADNPKATQNTVLVDPNSIQREDIAGDGSNGQTAGYAYHSTIGYNFGIAIREVGGSGTPIAKTVSEARDIDIPVDRLNPSSGGTSYDAVFFYTDQTLGWTSPVLSGNYILAAIPHVTFKLYSGSGILATAILNQSLDSIAFTFKSLGGTHTFKRIDVSNLPSSSPGTSITRTIAQNVTISGTESTFNHANDWGNPPLVLYARIYSDDIVLLDEIRMIVLDPTPGGQ